MLGTRRPSTYTFAFRPKARAASTLAMAKGDVAGTEHGRQVSARAKSRAEASQETQEPEPVPEDGKGELVDTFA